MYRLFHNTLSLALLALAGASSLSAAIVELTVTSRVDFDVADYPVEVPVDSFGVAAGAPELREWTLWCTRTDLPVPFQWLDKSADGHADTLLFMTRFGGGETRRFELREDPVGAAVKAFPKRTQAEISVKSGGKWEGRKYIGGEFHNVRAVTPPPQYTDHSEWIRYEGPGWESDRVGYRFYLDGRNGFDIFGKRTHAMVLQDVGLDGYASYHAMAEWGMDTLRVGPALGIGGYGLFQNGRVHRVDQVEQRSASVAANGHLYSAIDVRYDGWTVGNNKQDLKVRLGIYAGSHLTHVDLVVEPRRDIATGLVKLPGGELIHGANRLPEKDYTYLATFGPQSIIGDTLGMAIFYRPRDLRRLESDDHNHVVLLNPRNGTVHYAFAAVWEQEPGEDLTRESFIEYLERTALLLNRAPIVTAVSPKDRDQKSFPLSADDVLTWTTRMADSVLGARGNSLSFGQFDPESAQNARWRYTTGLLAMAFEELWKETSEQRYFQYVLDTIGSFIASDGSIHTYQLEEYNIDHINPGKQLIFLYEHTGEKRFREAANLLWKQLQSHPRTSEGGFWHKKIYPHQMWLDGLYMGSPFYAQYAARFGKEEAIPDVARQFILMEKHGHDAERDLLMHAWDESRTQNWADPETGRSHHAWARSLGWYAMALVDALDHLPSDSDEAASLREILNRTAAMVLRFQDKDAGLWWQILDLPDRAGNYLEASASSMFVYALTKGVNEGWLAPETFAAPALRAYEAMIERFVLIHADNSLSLDHICEVAGLSEARDGSFRYYMSEPIVRNDGKGMGPFLLAGLQIHRLLRTHR